MDVSVALPRFFPRFGSDYLVNLWYKIQLISWIWIRSLQCPNIPDPDFKSKILKLGIKQICGDKYKVWYIYYWIGWNLMQSAFSSKTDPYIILVIDYIYASYPLSPLLLNDSFALIQFPSIFIHNISLSAPYFVCTLKLKQYWLIHKYFHNLLISPIHLIIVFTRNAQEPYLLNVVSNTYNMNYKWMGHSRYISHNIHIFQDHLESPTNIVGLEDQPQLVNKSRRSWATSSIWIELCAPPRLFS